ncbi:pyruvate oxidase [Virgibacillus halophilus]|uniref:pyruvate oxidase n=1 Tax=Tigheibacillus halophilus TaxID=361280 RepID=UPI00362E9309
MSSKRTGEILTDLLIDWNVNHIYGMPGDSINEFVDDLRKKEDEIKFYQIRHEESGALAASAYAKLTGKIGVCLSIAGPGGIHLLNGLYDAKKDGAPVLALVGQVTSENVGTKSFQEIDLQNLFADVAVYCEQAQSAEQLPDMLNMAIRNAYVHQGVAVLIVPDDLFAVKQNGRQPSTAPSYVRALPFPHEVSLINSANMINEAKKPVILAGKGCRGADKELLQFAEKINAPIVVSLLGKGIIPDYHPLNMGQHGQIGTKPAYEAIMEADLLLLAGTSFPYRNFLPDDTKAIQIDIMADRIGDIYPITEGLCGDTKQILCKLDEMVENRTDNSRFLQKYQDKMKKWHKQMEKDKQARENPLIAPQVMHALEKVVDEDAVISCDVGNVTVWAARYFPILHQKFVISGRLATMGCGLPGAIAGQIAYPDKQVVGICGDGGFTMVMHDFVTAVKYGLPVKMVVLNNSKIAMIKYEQELLGHLEYETSLGEMDFASFAESCGGAGYRVDKAEDLDNAMEQAFTSNKPAIIDVAIKDMPPLPGKISYDQAIHFGEFLIKDFFTNKKVEVPDLKTSIERLL